jgi:hypothetical protein
MTDQEKADLVDLLARPQFRRFLFRAIQLSGIFDATANGTDERTRFLEGRRSLGLDILRDVDGAQPVQSPGGIPILTLLQVLREGAQSSPQEKPNGRRTGPYADLRSDDEPE